MSNTVISIKNLNKSYNGFKAVDDISFHVNERECFGFLGPNGAGKTTTMKVIYGKALYDSNENTAVDIFGYNPKDKFLDIKALSGIVPQQDNLDIQLNVRDNLYVYSKFYGMNKRTAEKRIEELLSFMELTEKSKAKVRELSGGMQRRLTIARALLNNPRLLLLDEPTTGLDPQVRHLIWNKLRELKEQGVTILLTTHYMEEAYQICDRLLIMDMGKKLLEGSPRAILADNIEKYVIEIYGVCKQDSSCTGYLDEAGIRYEFHNNTLFAYCNDSQKLAKAAETMNESDYHIRPSNLEDIFLKVTGRGLNELQ